MSEPTEQDVRVTAEIVYSASADQWSAHAYGGTGFPPVDLTVTAGTEEQVHADFIEQWNAADGSEWTPEQFKFVRNDPEPD
jgi:hypothetical protein